MHVLVQLEGCAILAGSLDDSRGNEVPSSPNIDSIAVDRSEPGNIGDLAV